MSDTIFALSSGAPPSAIAIIRISGPQAESAAQALAGTLPPARRASLRPLRDGNALLDEAIVLTFPAHSSVTGEPLVELHVHGGRATIASVMRALSSREGLRPAMPGEFTRRAFFNGRTDLTQVEALADLLAAETDIQRRAALGMLQGGLSAKVEAWREALLAASARAEAAIDFDDEDDVEPWPAEEPADLLNALHAEITAVLAHPPAERLRDGLRVVLAGSPNAGKSTLFNRLVGREAAIATPIAGTTRDLIEAPVDFWGLPLVFIDTAGLHDDQEVDSVEAIGIQRAREVIECADLVLWLDDDLPPPDLSGQVIPVYPQCDRRPPPLGDSVVVSAKTGEGLEALRAAILEKARALLPPPGAVSLNERQRLILAAMNVDIGEAARANDLLVVAEHLRCARHALDALIGRTGTEDMLDALFGRFCIGK